MKLQFNLKTFVICIGIPLLVGGLSALLTMNSMEAFAGLNKPPLSPPGFLFPIVWTILYILMGIASYLVLTSGETKEDITDALLVYALQLAFNFFWPLFFFGLNWYLFSFFWLLILWGLILYTTILFYRISKPAAYLLIPYLLWVSFAGYLNLGIALMN